MKVLLSLCFCITHDRWPWRRKLWYNVASDVKNSKLHDFFISWRMFTLPLIFLALNFF